MEAGKKRINDIFNRTRILEIPFFQRSYVWSEDDWERFVDDLLEVGRERISYFLGSIILKQKPTPTGSDGGDVRIVVDGQQRLTSLMLLFRVIGHHSDEAPRFEDVFRTYDGELALRHNHNDEEVFRALTLNPELDPDLRTKYEGNRVLGAYDYFKSREDELASIEIGTLLNHLYFVGIDLDEKEDEQQIFDTINSLGVELTTAELLKNELFDREDLRLFKRTWLPAFEADQEQKQYWSREVTAGRTRRDNVDLFLQAFLLNQPGVSDDVRVSDLFSEYRSYLRSDEAPARPELIEDLTRSANLYRDHVDPVLLEESLSADDQFHRMNVIIFGLQTTTIMPYVLHVLRTVRDADTQAALLQIIETYILRRLVTGATTKHYNRFFAALVRSGVNDPDELVTRVVQPDDPSVRLPSDEEVLEKLPTVNLTNAQARVALYLLEASIRDEDAHSTRIAGLRHYQVEHVMPKKWANHWGTLSEPETRTRDELVRRPGNLTLLSAKLNRTIRDSNWEKKKHGTERYDGLAVHGAGLDIFSRWIQNEAWTEDDIRARSRWLAERATEVWPYPA